MEKKGIQTKSADTSIIENRFRNTKPGDVITYEELTTMLGRNAIEFCRSNINSARRALVKESIFFDCIPNEGFKRLTNAESVDASQHYLTRSRKAAHRGQVHIDYVLKDGLSEDSLKRLASVSTQLAAVELFASSKATKRIEKSLTDASHKLAIGETLKLFGG